MNRLEQALHRLVARRLASPLAIWGKLPSHVDYVSVGATVGDAQAWQRWVAEQWSPPPARAPRSRRGDVRGWIHLEPPPPASAEPHAAPVAFQLPAMGEPHAGPWWRGAMVNSRDRIGRPHPLIVYQRVTPRWLAGEGARMQAAPGAREPSYWLARVLARWQAHHESLGRLCEAVSALDEAFAPGWTQLFGRPAGPVPAARLEGIVRALGDDRELPDAMDATARRRRSPARAPLSTDAEPRFWLFDARGARLQGAACWPELWRAAA